MNINLKLFLTFLKIGAFTFGGGYSMIPFIESEAVEKNKWITGEEMADMIAIAESTPGPIAVNAATFVGKKVGGFLGAALATLGVCLPAYLIISVLSILYTKFYETRAIRYAFMGVRAAVLALIIKAMFSVYAVCPRKLYSYAIIVGAFVLANVFKVNILLIILLSALTGLVFFLTDERKGDRS